MKVRHPLTCLALISFCFYYQLHHHSFFFSSFFLIILPSFQLHPQTPVYPSSAGKSGLTVRALLLRTSEFLTSTVGTMHRCQILWGTVTISLFILLTFIYGAKNMKHTFLCEAVLLFPICVRKIKCLSVILWNNLYFDIIYLFVYLSELESLFRTVPTWLFGLWIQWCRWFLPTPSWMWLFMSAVWAEACPSPAPHQSSTLIQPHITLVGSHNLYLKSFFFFWV